MRRHPATLLSKLARLVPVLLLVVAVAAAPALAGMEKHASQHEQTTSCCHSDSVDPSQPNQGDDDDCCGKNCHGCLCPCAKLILISGLRLAPAQATMASVLPHVVLSALSLSDADPIFHPPRV